MAFMITPIDPELWDHAGWSGTAFLRDPSGLERPGMTLLFGSEKAGHLIFSGGHLKIGAADTEECIRVAIIEGDVPGQKPGYFVHIGAMHLPNFKRDFRRLGHYWLMPGFFRRGNPEAEWELAILKRKLALRTVEEIGEHDIDRVYFHGETN